MRCALAILFFMMLVARPVILLAQEPLLYGYQETNGAVTNGYAGDTVDPYFATKAMLILLDTDSKAKQPAMAWVVWGLQMQRSDGLFERYKRDGEDNWHPYARADADDAVLALWLELLYRLTPAEGMQESWKNSAEMAEKQLSALYDPVQGIYHISVEMPIGLLMDNVEIYSAYMRIAKEQHRLGLKAQATASRKKAAILAQNIVKIFKPEGSVGYLVSTQQPNGELFYPDRVAQLYPLLYKLPDGDNAASVYTIWMSANGKEWLLQKDNNYAWGLVAITALKKDDNYSASCWQNRAEPMRYSEHWNVLEEAALQYVKWRLQVRHYDTHIPCVGGNL